MAFLLNDDEEQNQGGESQSQPQIGGGQSAQVGAGGGSSTNAGVGKGGQGGWTNLQSYIGANQTDTGGASALKQTVGDQFNTEKQNISNASGQYLSDAQKQLDEKSIDKNEASDLVKNSALSYNWSGSQSDDYNKNVSKVRDALTSQYSGPTSYSYGLGAQAQQYGNQLGDDKSFNKMMGDIYANRAGQALSTGQRGLQNQLDIYNTALNDARSNLLKDYDNLNIYRDDTVKDTTNKLSGMADQYRTNQTALRDYLSNSATQYDQQEAQKEAEARQAYQNTLKTEGTGKESIATNWIERTAHPGDPRSNDNYRNLYISRDMYGPNLTWNQLQNEQNLVGINTEAKVPLGGVSLWNQAGAGDEMAARAGLLQNFYAGQDAKYAGTGEEERKSYNAIMDFLNSDAARKEQNFQVRK